MESLETNVSLDTAESSCYLPVGQQASVSEFACATQNREEGQQVPSPQDLSSEEQELSARAHPPLTSTSRLQNGVERRAKALT